MKAQFIWPYLPICVLLACEISLEGIDDEHRGDESTQGDELVSAAGSPATNQSALAEGNADEPSADMLDDDSFEWIDFEDLVGMPNSLMEVPSESRLTNQYATRGVVFASGSANFASAVNLGNNHATSGVVGIGAAAADATLRYGEPLVITFVSPSDATVPATTSFVSIRGDLIPATHEATMTAYDLSGIKLGDVSAADVSEGLVLELSSSKIHRVVISQTGEDIAFDDLKFKPVQ